MAGMLGKFLGSRITLNYTVLLKLYFANSIKSKDKKLLLKEKKKNPKMESFEELQMT